METVEKNLRQHVNILCSDIGSRSILEGSSLRKAQDFIHNQFEGMGLPVRVQNYTAHGVSTANLLAVPGDTGQVSPLLLLGAHYDTVPGTPGADDNASAVAVQLETARQLMMLKDRHELDLSAKLVSFPLEEPPAFGTRQMGSSVYAYNAWKKKEQIDGMICLEMVGYTCHAPGCQRYPFPLKFFGYPKEGSFIGLVGNYRSREFAASMLNAFRKNPKLPAVKLMVPLNGWILPSVRLSDHASFWDQGFKAVMVTDSAFYRNPHYHLASDTMDTLDYYFMAELVESLVLFLTTAP